MQNYHLKLVTNILVIFMSLLFLIKIFDIGIISDYTKTYSHSGNAILNERSFFENLNYELKLYYLDLGFIRLVKIVQHILGNFNSIFIFKSLHFIIYITLFIQIYFLFKKYLSASFALLSLILFLGLSQVTEYLDPFVAWPEAYALSVVIGLINIALFLKIIKKKKINFIFIFINLISYFYQEMAAPYALLPLIAYIILLLKDKNVDKTFYFYFLNFILYITSKFLILYFTSDETIAASSSLKYLYPESFISAWYHALRTFPMTWLFVDGKFEMFQLYIKENYFYVSLIFILSLITSFFVIRNIDGDRENLDIKNIKVLSFIGVYQFLFPIVLIALNKRYNIQITNHGLGHAHYLVLSQCLGLLFVLLVLTAKFRIFILKYTIVFSVLISFLTTVSFQLSDFTSKRLEPKRHLYPYIFFENIKDFAEKYEIEKFVILNNNNSGFWQDNRIMSSIFKKKVKVYGNWMFNENKINNLEIGKHSNTLLMYDLKLNNILHSSKFCLLTDILNNSENNFEYRCSNKFYYESKKMLKYFESDSFIKKVN